MRVVSFCLSFSLFALHSNDRLMAFVDSCTTVIINIS